MFEILRDGKPISELFFSEEQAIEWIVKHSDGATYEIKVFDA